MDLSHQNELSPYVTNIEVISPSPTLVPHDLDEDEEPPYIEDNNIRIYVSSQDTILDCAQDFSLGSPQALDSPSGSGYSSSYYSARSNFAELSPRIGLDANSENADNCKVPERHAEYLYNPADFENPYTPSSLLVYHEEDYMPQSSSLFASKPVLNLSGHRADPSRIGHQAHLHLPPEPLSPLLLTTSNSRLSTPPALPSSGMFDHDSGIAGSISITPPVQVDGGVIAVTPAESSQRIRATKYKGASPPWSAVAQLSSSTAQKAPNPILRESVGLLQPFEDLEKPFAAKPRSTVMVTPPKSKIKLVVPRLDDEGVPIEDWSGGSSFTAEELEVIALFNSPTTVTIAEPDEVQQFDHNLSQSQDDTFPHINKLKSGSHSRISAHFVESSTDPSSPPSSPGRTYRPSGVIRNQRDAETSRRSLAKLRPNPYPLEVRKIYKHPNSSPSSPPPPSASITAQIHRLFATITRAGTTGSSRRQDVPSGHFPEHLRNLASQIARIKELRKKFTLGLAVPEKKADAQVVSDYLNIILHEGDVLQKDDGPKLLRLLYKLAEAAQVYPTRLLLKGVEMASQPFEGGGFADVFKGRHDNDQVCIKVIRIFESRGQAQVLKAYVREIILWSHMSHENILPFYGLYALDESAQRICLVSPLMKNGNLRVFLQNNPKTPRLPLVLDIIEGLSYLHRSNIIHGDLKAQNILVSDDGRALITDFGLSYIAMATTAGSTELEAAGTMNWMAPELISATNLAAKPTKESDIWSFGCLCYEIYTGNFPFHQYKNRAQVLFALLRGEIPVRPTMEDLVCDHLDDWMWDPIMLGCWKNDPQDRLSCREIRDTLTNHVMQDHRSKTCHWDEKKSAFWQAMKDRSENQVESRHVENILVGFLKAHEQSSLMPGPSP